MIRNVSYKARKKFKYMDRVINIGDVWEPEGAKNDDMIKRSRLVVRFESAVNESLGEVVRMNITATDAVVDEAKVVVPDKPKKRAGRPINKTVSKASKTPSKRSVAVEATTTPN